MNVFSWKKVDSCEERQKVFYSGRFLIVDSPYQPWRWILNLIKSNMHINFAENSWDNGKDQIIWKEHTGNLEGKS